MYADDGDYYDENEEDDSGQYDPDEYGDEYYGDEEEQPLDEDEDYDD